MSQASKFQLLPVKGISTPPHSIIRVRSWSDASVLPMKHIFLCVLQKQAKDVSNQSFHTSSDSKGPVCLSPLYRLDVEWQGTEGMKVQGQMGPNLEQQAPQFNGRFLLLGTCVSNISHSKTTCRISAIFRTTGSFTISIQ